MEVFKIFGKKSGKLSKLSRLYYQYHSGRYCSGSREKNNLNQLLLPEKWVKLSEIAAF